MSDRKTFFLDIDGCVFKHTGKPITHGIRLKMLTCPDVYTKLNEMEAAGHCIIFTTARKESYRAITEKQLNDYGLPYDHLIMGIGQGERIVVNDRSKEGEDRAAALNVDRDEGLGRLMV